MAVSDALRAWVESHKPCDDGVYLLSANNVRELLAIADSIDRDHAVRMEQSKRDMRRATCRYMRAVIRDYELGCKRVRKHHARKDANGDTEDL